MQTPVFMNVGTQAAIKGGVSALDLKNVGCQIELSNTYHLHLRPGDKVVRQMGGLHKFMNWECYGACLCGIRLSLYKSYFVAYT